VSVIDHMQGKRCVPTGAHVLVDHKSRGRGRKPSGWYLLAAPSPTTVTFLGFSTRQKVINHKRQEEASIIEQFFWLLTYVMSRDIAQPLCYFSAPPNFSVCSRETQPIADKIEHARGRRDRHPAVSAR
jgi:hypothetical protein